MFTGIVEEIGRVTEAGPDRLVIEAPGVTRDLKVSDSICLNGACLTVTSRKGGTFAVDVVPETLRRTNLGTLNRDDPVDLERPLAIGGRFGGHVVQGHVDGTATVESIRHEGDALLLAFRAPQSIMRYIVEKGFVAVDGTSLTVVNCDSQSFLVTIIPYTRDNTVLGTRRVGDSVNVEADIIAKYVERLASGSRSSEDITEQP